MKPYIALLAVLSSLAFAQEAPTVRDYGSFRRMQHRQDYAPQVAVKDAAGGPGWYAIGALDGLRGEITVHDGQVFLSLGKSMDGRIAQRDAGDARATLLAAAKVEAWDEVPIPRAMPQAELRAFILAQAGARGLDADRAWPFRIRGDIVDYRWHVLAEPHPDYRGHGSAAPMARQYETAGPRMAAEVIGFHSGAALEGVISHPGERFHEHLLDPARTLTGHLDAFGVAAEAVLLLPRFSGRGDGTTNDLRAAPAAGRKSS